MEYADATTSEWYNACSAGGANTYPYGTAYIGAACNGLDNATGATLPVGSNAACEGGFPGLFDLSGNVHEWEDSCSGRAGEYCRIRGGSFTQPMANLVCSLGDETYVFGYRVSRTADVGFRCCGG
jgi:formylglycine-generating enzyme required for sulfatase activity